MRALAIVALISTSACVPYSTRDIHPQAVAYCRYQASRAASIEGDIGVMQGCLNYVRMTGDIPR